MASARRWCAPGSSAAGRAATRCGGAWRRSSANRPCLPICSRGDARGGGSLRRHRHFDALRSEEHTSELQSLMRISYAVFCLKKKKQKNEKQYITKKQTAKKLL